MKNEVKSVWICGTFSFNTLLIMKSWNYKKPKQEKILTPFKKEDGYNYVRLWKDGKSEDMRICDMVAKTFVPNPENMPFVIHINGDWLDDKADNLKWSWIPETKE